MRKQNYISSVFFLFAFFFVSPVLSPSIGGNTIYLSWFIPFSDLKFLKRITNIKLKLLGIIGFFIFAGIIILRSNYMMIIKAMSIIFSVMYLQYAYEKIGFRNLYKAFNINIIIAILQFILYYVDYRVAYLFGPSNISRLIWGALATDTNTNFYPIFFFPRTCGLSREAGFFAALLCIIITIYICDKKIKKNRTQKILFLIAYIVSFSKMSFALLIMLGVLYFKKKLDKIPLLLMIFIFIVSMGTFANFLNETGFFTIASGTWAHRFWGYGVVYNHLNVKEFLIGNSLGVEELNKAALKAFPVHELLFFYGYGKFCGLPDLIIYTGYIGILSFLMFLSSLKVKSGYLLILLISTADVDLLTATSFVVLAYWLTSFGLKNEKIILIDKIKK